MQLNIVKPMLLLSKLKKIAEQFVYTKGKSCTCGNIILKCDIRTSTSRIRH